MTADQLYDVFQDHREACAECQKLEGLCPEGHALGKRWYEADSPERQRVTRRNLDAGYKTDLWDARDEDDGA